MAILLAILIMALCFPPGFLLAGTQDPKPPKFINISSYPVGALGTILATAFCDAIEKQTGIRSRPTPADTQLGRVLPVKSGRAQVSVLAASSLYYGSEGLGDFSAENWGPQKLRLVFSGNRLHHGIAVKANSEIKTWADLKGKKITEPAGIFKTTTRAFLAYGGLSEQEVVFVKASGYVGSLRMVMDGTADACHAGPEASLMKQWEAAPYGLRWLPMDPEDSAAWDRLGQIAPFMAASNWLTYGALGEGGPKHLAFYPYTLTSYDTINENDIYIIVKAMVEGRDLYKDVKKPVSGQWTLEDTLDLKKPIQIPFHPGLIKYANEVGKWTPELETWRANALKAEEKRINKWNAK